MSFKDLDEFFAIQPIRLPIKGKTYSFPGSVSGRTGLLLHRMTEMAEEVKRASDAGEEPDFGEQVLDDAGETDLLKEVLGDAHQEMLDDGLPHAYIDHAFKTLIVHHQFGAEVAEQVWLDVPGAPKEPEDRKPKARKATSASATTTKRQGSTKSTSSEKSAAATAGGESSPTGD